MVETGGNKRKCIIGSMPLFKTESLDSESETDSLPVHSKFIDNVSKLKRIARPKFGVYQDDRSGSFKTGRSGFKCNDKHTLLDAKKCKATLGVWELLA